LLIIYPKAYSPTPWEGRSRNYSYTMFNCLVFVYAVRNWFNKLLSWGYCDVILLNIFYWHRTCAYIWFG
jgi:hypothetical protein